MTPDQTHEVIEAILLHRWKPLVLDFEHLQNRIEFLKDLIHTFRLVPLSFASSDSEAAKNILAFINEGQTEQALAYLQSPITFEKSDEKKWPALTDEDKAIRLLEHYFEKHPDRFVIERAFRLTHAQAHARKASKHLQQFPIVAVVHCCGHEVNQEHFSHCSSCSLLWA